VRSTLSFFVVIFLSSSGAFAQDTTSPPSQDPAQKPPAAVGEAGTKPTRGFVSSLSHNLVDDVKHLPRKNSLYFLIGGGVAALAVHPYDKQINERFEGANGFYKPGKYIGNTAVLIGASAATYIVGPAARRTAGCSTSAWTNSRGSCWRAGLCSA